MTRFALLIVTLALGLGCDSTSTVADGGTDGGSTATVDPSRTIASLSLEESRALCDGLVAAQGGAGTTVTCDGFELTVQSVDDCAASIEAATCTNTVAELNACIAILDDDPCKLLTDPACAVVPACATEG